MLENLNYGLFYLINATPNSMEWIVGFAKFIAKDLIDIVPILVIILWIWGPRTRVRAQRQLVIKAVMALLVGQFISWLLGRLFPYNRPFVDHIGCNFLHHVADDSFPSNHGTIIFTFAFAFLLWHRVWYSTILLTIAVAIAWSRVYLGVHWPVDMVGGFLVGIISCLSTQILWSLYGAMLYSRLEKIYRFCFSFPIRKGWIRD